MSMLSCYIYSTCVGTGVYLVLAIYDKIVSGFSLEATSKVGELVGGKLMSH